MSRPPPNPALLAPPRWMGLLLIFTLCTAVWFMLYSDPLQSFHFTQPVTDVLETFPLWILVSLGAYALGSIGLSLMCFNTCPEAVVALSEDIRQAKADLWEKGFDTDH
ncbi:dolichol-phosphate mannosyltransferase subunit 3-like protein [Nannochloropsis gaditana CCMP526]|uniref:dolichol-phosphate mannosyltransferase subunit 3-like protein n=1 Tax=Nannochloropsis gaditana (strain CCMP526) TaxID=1093141 RepID=UPI00029F6B24|nr:dolichol-phosphate mannosyltransferase subunit 3-like protein [Nannochloropsis gaditana CCMP526]EKU21403.1 dolichol-phosphate mannosyltransferase subunit 3-like protein [Nannochloropsis gaditana CCMP526]|eukprot:XP_005854963.1 dolichol-phosphate mannosyltransferase subunit 3-like protein [Nannochloropsis gaditana CCMP526]